MNAALLSILVIIFPLLAVAQEPAAVGEPAPEFSLQALNSGVVKLEDLKGKIVVLEWFNPECPFVGKHYKSGHMQDLQKNFTDKGVIWLTVSSSSPESSGYVDGKRVKELEDSWKIKSTYILDDSKGLVGKRYGAKTTPHMYIINAQGVLVYKGAIDDNPRVDANPHEAKNYVKIALDSLMQNKDFSPAETKPYGCSIKY